MLNNSAKFTVDTAPTIAFLKTLPDGDMSRLFKKANTGEFLSASEARSYLEGLEAEGHTALPSSGQIGERG